MALAASNQTKDDHIERQEKELRVKFEQQHCLIATRFNYLYRYINYLFLFEAPHKQNVSRIQHQTLVLHTGP